MPFSKVAVGLADDEGSWLASMSPAERNLEYNILSPSTYYRDDKMKL